MLKEQQHRDRVQKKAETMWLVASQLLWSIIIIFMPMFNSGTILVVLSIILVIIDVIFLKKTKLLFPFCFVLFTNIVWSILVWLRLYYVNADNIIFDFLFVANIYRGYYLSLHFIPVLLYILMVNVYNKNSKFETLPVLCWTFILRSSCFCCTFFYKILATTYLGWAMYNLIYWCVIIRDTSLWKYDNVDVEVLQPSEICGWLVVIADCIMCFLIIIKLTTNETRMVQYINGSGNNCNSSNNNDGYNDETSMHTVGTNTSINSQILRNNDIDTENLSDNRMVENWKENVGAHKQAHTKYQSLVDKSQKLNDDLTKNCLQKYNITAQTLIVLANAIVTTTMTSVLFFMSIDDCIYTTTNKNGEKKSHFRSSCAVKLTSIGIGIAIIIVIFFTLCIKRCSCYKINKNKNNWIYLILESLTDDHLRAIITLKFAFFIVKPALISSTQSEKSSKTLELASNIIFSILIFVSVTVLAIATYDKQYKILSLISFQFVKIKNSQFFARFHIFVYIITVLQTYAISTLILLFVLYADDNNINWFNWSWVIYPPCPWLFFIKLYLNEVSQLIKTLESVKITNDDKDEIGDENNSSKDIDIPNSIKIQVVLYLRRLFWLQVSVLVLSVTSTVVYIVWIVIGKNIDLYAQYYDYGQGNWPLLWIFQCLMSLMMVVIIVLTMIHSRITEIKL